MLPWWNPQLVAGLIVLAAAGAFGYHGIYLKAQLDLQQIRQQQRQAEALQQGRVQLSEALEIAERYREQLAPRKDVDWLVQSVGRIARESGVQLSKIEPQQPRELDDLTSLAVSLQFTASYHQLGRFLSQVESHQPCIRVGTLEVSHRLADADGAQVQLVLQALYAPPLATRVQ
jgi:Tfp pilus assembly protein PilO